ncbi:MAG: hypothetical protein ABUL73_05890 [Alphaproteobacteria bacterium]
MSTHPACQALSEAHAPLSVRALAVALGAIAVVGLFLQFLAAGARIVA